LPPPEPSCLSSPVHQVRPKPHPLGNRGISQCHEEIKAVAASRLGCRVVPPRCLDDILRCGVYGKFAMAYHEM
jgi:hypothetical protein